MPALGLPERRKLATVRNLERAGARSASAAQRPWLTELLAQSFAVCTHYVSSNARRLYADSELPPALERIAANLQRSSRTWFAWLDDQTTRFVVAELAAHRDQQGRDEALRLFFYDHDGNQLASGEWRLDSEGRWTLLKRSQRRSRL